VPTPGGLSEISAVLALLKLMGIFGPFFVWVTQTRINTANFYLAMTNMHAFAKVFAASNCRFVWATIVGILVYLIMLTNVFSFMLQELAYQGIFVVAWVAIALAYILFVRKKEPQKDLQHEAAEVAPLNRRGLTAWFGSAALGIVLANLGGLAASFSTPATALTAFVLFVL
jgi:purine-cytosine permease-like protein